MVWLPSQNAFELVGILSVITNCALMYLSPGLRADPRGHDWVLAFLVVEHVVLGLKFVVNGP